MPADIPAQQDVASLDELIAAARDCRARQIVVRGKLEDAPSIRLAPGHALIGEDPGASIANQHVVPDPFGMVK
ncbi:MAG TPA: hypothetical protein VF814_15610 [Casimicrobiaceae bacterium]